MMPLVKLVSRKIEKPCLLRRAQLVKPEDTSILTDVRDPGLHRKTKSMLEAKLHPVHMDEMPEEIGMN